MKFSPVPLSKEKHLKTCISQNGTTEHIEKMHLAPVYIYELPEAAVNYPILFLKEDNELPKAILMWGLEPEENLYVRQNKWYGGFMPSILKLFPFVASDTKEKDKLALGIYEDAHIVNETEGERILNDDGSKSAWFTDVVSHMKRIIEHEEATLAALKILDTMDLFVPQELKIQPPEGNEIIIGGFSVIDRNKFYSLNDEQINELKSQDLLEPIFAHFISLNNIGKLIRLKYHN